MDFLIMSSDMHRAAMQWKEGRAEGGGGFEHITFKPSICPVREKKEET